MAQIHNSDLFKELKDGAKIQQLSDVIPSQLAEKVVPVMEVNPKLLRRTNVCVSVVAIVTGAQIVYTTPVDRDFYLTGATISLVKDATCDQATGSIVLNCTQDGATKNIGRIPLIVTTAQQFTQEIVFDNPMKIDRGINFNFTASYTAGLMSRVASIRGYTLENSNA